jgi:NADH:ubiquinone reductase (non-electrogenic)
MLGTNGSIFAFGDCTASSYAPTAQVASQQGAYLARLLGHMAKKTNLDGKLLELENRLAVTADEEERKKISQEADDVKKHLARVKLTPFHYSHQGSLAYVFSSHCCLYSTIYD